MLERDGHIKITDFGTISLFISKFALIVRNVQGGN